MRVPYDTKSHKLSRKVARRAKEARNAMAWRSDDMPRDVDAKRVTRRLRRVTGVVFALALVLVIGAHHADARGASSGGNHGHHSARAHSSSAAGNSAVSTFRAYYSH